jgi:GTP-binding protein Era
MIPEHPRYYDEEEMSDKPMRFFVGEIVREKILLNYDQEIPYSCEVEVNSYKEEDEVIEIECTIFVARDSQKGIIVGKQGAAIKQLGIDARKSLEKFLQKKVRLNTWVKVNKDWRDQEDQLKKYGYFN